MIIGPTSSIYIGRGSASVGPRPPTAPAFTAADAEEPGELTIDVLTLPSNWGDLAVYNDGFGAAGSLVWWNQIDGWQELVIPPATGERTVQIPAELWGLESFSIRVSGLSAAGRRGRAAGALIVGFVGGSAGGAMTPGNGLTPPTGTTQEIPA